jgi:hypothetical protein
MGAPPHLSGIHRFPASYFGRRSCKATSSSPLDWVRGRSENHAVLAKAEGVA